MLLGVVVKELGSSVQFWFGTTLSSADLQRDIETTHNRISIMRRVDQC